MQASRYHFDRFGAYLGYVDPSGRYYQRDGTCRGLIGTDGALIDCEGVCRGRFDVQGQFWDEKGGYGGYLAQPDGVPPVSMRPAPRIAG